MDQVDGVGEFGGIPHEENGTVVGHNILVALVPFHLGREATLVTNQIVRCRLADGDETFLAVGTRNIGNVSSGIGLVHSG